MKYYFVYIITNQRHTVLYVGITNDLITRISQHRLGTGSDFTSKYRISALVHYETFDDVNAAIYREKQIKKFRREKKEALINKSNPQWLDLYETLY